MRSMVWRFGYEPWIPPIGAISPPLEKGRSFVKMYGGHFEITLRACETPDAETMDFALGNRGRMPPEQAHFLTYIACFTHYAEAKEVLSAHGITLSHNPIAAFDNETGLRHVKLLISDLTRSILDLDVHQIAKRNGARVFENRLAQRHSSGQYVLEPRDRISGETSAAYRAHLAEYEFGVHEYVASFDATRFAADVNTGAIVHCAMLPNRSRGVNVARVFSNAGAVLLVNDPDPVYNLSLKRLMSDGEFLGDLGTAPWFVVKNGHENMAGEFLERRGLKRRILSPARNAHDYLRYVVSYLTGSGGAAG